MRARPYKGVAHPACHSDGREPLRFPGMGIHRLWGLRVLHQGSPPKKHINTDVPDMKRAGTMGGPYLDRGEAFVVTTHRISVDFVLYDMVLTSRNLVLIDNRSSKVEVQKIPLGNVLSVAAGRVASGEPVITLTFTETEWTDPVPPMNLLFTQHAGENRKQERDAWTRSLMEQIVAVRQGAEQPARLTDPEKKSSMQPAATTLRGVDIPSPHRSVVKAEPVPVRLEVKPEEPEQEQPVPAPEHPAPVAPAGEGMPDADLDEPIGEAGRVPDLAGGIQTPVPEEPAFQGKGAETRETAPAEPVAGTVPAVPVHEEIPPGRTEVHHEPEPPAAGVMSADGNDAGSAILPAGEAEAAEARLPMEQRDHTSPVKETSPPPVAPARVPEREPAPKPAARADPAVTTPGAGPAETALLQAPGPEQPGRPVDAAPALPEERPSPAKPPESFPDHRRGSPSGRGGRALLLLVLGAVVLFLVAGGILWSAGNPAVPAGQSPAPVMTVPATVPSLSVTMSPEIRAATPVPPPATIPSPGPTVPPSPVAIPLPNVTPALTAGTVPPDGLWLRVSCNSTFIGYYGRPGALLNVGGRGEKHYPLPDDIRLVEASFQKQDYSGSTLTVELYRDGTVITSRSVRSPMGSISFIVDAETGGFPGGIPTPTSPNVLVSGETYTH